jgi:RimJ/RimL family protein N-acetyltransferase
MHPLSYLHFQMQLEGIGLDGLTMDREKDSAPGEPPPLLLVARLPTQEIITYYNACLPEDLQASLAACLHEVRFPHVEPLLDLLRAQDVRPAVEHCLTHIFHTPPPTFTDRIVSRYGAQDARLAAFEFEGLPGPVFGIEQYGRVAAACVSSRENEHCGEAWVVTLPEFHRQGLGTRVVQTWARSLMLAGKVPFYSCRIDNTASLALARSLGLQPVFEEIAIAAA